MQSRHQVISELKQGGTNAHLCIILRVSSTNQLINQTIRCRFYDVRDKQMLDSENTDTLIRCLLDKSYESAMDGK